MDNKKPIKILIILIGIVLLLTLLSIPFGEKVVNTEPVQADPLSQIIGLISILLFLTCIIFGIVLLFRAYGAKTHP